MVLLPSAYYEAGILREDVHNPCERRSLKNSTCLKMSYPDSSVSATVSWEAFRYEDGDERENLEEIAAESEEVPSLGRLTSMGNETRVSAEITVQNPGSFVLIVEYHNENDSAQVAVQMNTVSYEDEGFVTLHQCPYRYKCLQNDYLYHHRVLFLAHFVGIW